MACTPKSRRQSPPAARSLRAFTALLLPSTLALDLPLTRLRNGLGVQTISLYPSLPEAYRKVLANLYDGLPPKTNEVIRAIILEALGGHVEEIFRESLLSTSPSPALAPNARGLHICR